MDKKKILVVEDDNDLLELITIKLNYEGFDVTGAATGQAALDYLQDHLPDFVILDILLPDIDGLTILHQIATNPRIKHLPVIILSNIADEGSYEQAAAIGKYDYLVKTKTDLNDLSKMIKKKLKMER